MSVYKEGYHIVESLLKQSKQIYPDACDFGVLVKKDDKNWNQLVQLIEWYGKEGTRKVNSCGVTQQVMLMDEWAVSDERKTVKEATEIFQVDYNRISRMKDVDGLITITKLK